MQIQKTLVAAAVAVIPALLSAQKLLTVGSLTISQPKAVVELDMNRLKGEPSRLAWSPDGSQLYLQTLEGGFGRPGATLRHYQIVLASGKVEDLQAEPGWVGAYWTAKSDKSSPDVPSLQIAPEQSQRMERTTSTPMGGNLARGGTDTGGGTSDPGVAPDAVGAASASQRVNVITLKLGTDVIGEFVNAPLVPGLTFGWGPKGTEAIAFSAQKSGRVVIMDKAGKKQEVSGSKDSLLPAWSPDASQLAWLQKDGRKKFQLYVSTVSGS